MNFTKSPREGVHPRENAFKLNVRRHQSANTKQEGATNVIRTRRFRLNIGTKLIASYLALTLLLVVVALIGVTASGRIQAAYLDIVERRDKIVLAIKDLSLQVEASDHDLGWFALTGAQSLYDDIALAQKQAEADLSELEKDVRSEEGKALLAKTTAANGDYWRALTDAASRVKAGLGGRGFSQAAALAAASGVDAPQGTLIKALDEFLKYQQDQTEAGQAGAARTQSSSRLEIIIVALVSAAVALGLGLFLSQNIARPVRRLTDSSRRSARNGPGEFRALLFREPPAIDQIQTARLTQVR